jgi:hypothetical protein
MEEALRFAKTYEAVIYGVLLVLGIWQIRKFILSWDEVRGAAFGLERESAQTHLNQAAVMLVLILAIAMSEFIMVSFVVPTVPGALPLFTPTVDLLATPTITLSPELLTPGVENTVTPQTPSPSQAVVQGVGCIPKQLTITSPLDGQEISGVVILTGTVDVPDLGFYKYEVSRPDENIWLTIQAGREVKQEAKLGEWDTRTLPQGDYLLRLVATDNKGDSLATCTIRVRIVAPKETYFRREMDWREHA